MEELKQDISLKARKKLPEYIKDKRNNIIFKNIIIAILVTLYFAFLQLGYCNITKNVYVNDLRVFSTVLLVISIIFFENGYKKDNEGIFLYGVETLLIAFITLTMPFTMFEASRTMHIFIELSFIYFIIYYIIKSLIQVRKVKKEYLTSDVRELVKNKERN